MRNRGMGDKAQKSHIRAIKDFAAFLGRSPDTATLGGLRAYQLHMADTGVTPSTFNVRIVALPFFFSTTCGREEMKRYMQFHRQPRKLPAASRPDRTAPWAIFLNNTCHCRGHASSERAFTLRRQSAWRRHLARCHRSM